MQQISWLLALLVSAGSTTGVNIQQDPPMSLMPMKSESVTLDCRHDDTSHYYLYWYRQKTNGELSLIAYSINKGDEQLEEPFKKSKYTFTRTEVLKSSLKIKDLESADSATYFCATSNRDSNANPAYFGQGTKLTVLENGLEITRPIVKVFPPSKEEICDRDIHKKRKSLSVTLVCVAKDFYPDHVSVIWKINGDDQSQKGAVGKVGTDNSATRDKNGKYYSITSRLRIPLKTWGNAKNTFTCRVDFYNGTHNDPEEASINGQLVPGMPDPDKPLKSAQTAKFAYGIFIAKSCVFGLFIFIFVKKMSRGAKDGKW